MIVKQMKIGLIENFCYIVGDEESLEGAVIDPSANGERIIDEIAKLKLKVKYVINTHGHGDHTGANRDIVMATGAKIAAHALCQSKHDVPLEDGAILKLGNLDLKVMHTPGHTRDGICILAGAKALFTGDTLFVGECGRADLPGSSPEALWRSLFEKLSKLPDDIIVLPGHDYGGKPFSTIGEEKKTNYTLQPRTVDEFVKFMAE